LSDFTSSSPRSLFQIFNNPNPNKQDLPIIGLHDYRYDPRLIDGDADRTEFIFFDTPGIPNNFLYNERRLNDFECELKQRRLQAYLPSELLGVTRDEVE
jgi:hypothetical protein